MMGSGEHRGDPEASAGRPMPPSLWVATARPGPVTAPLTESARADVAIIGAGFTGLSTALHLAEAGAGVCVLEAAEPGWGASGRNGGQVIPGLKYDPDELVRRFGSTQAEPMIAMAGDAADVVFDLIARYRIDCHAVRKGWLQSSRSVKVLPAIRARAEQWRRRGAAVAVLDRAEVARRMGTEAFAGGWIDYRAGAIQPLDYTRGLVRAAQSHGARVHGETLATRLQRNDRSWRIDTAGGASVTAERVVIATNGYTDGLWPQLRQTVIAANSFIVATQPLTGPASDSILPGGEVNSDAQRLLLYLRRDATGRLLIGGRGGFPDPRGAAEFAHLERALALLFPQLGRIEYQYRWAGRVAITRDSLPHIHEPAPGITIALGYNGRGVAMASSVGKYLAARLLATGGRAAEQPFALPITPIRPIPLHGLQRFYIAAGVRWFSLLDRLS